MTRKEKENPERPTLQDFTRGDKITWEEYLNTLCNFIKEENGVKAYTLCNIHYTVYNNLVYIGYGYGGMSLASKFIDNPPEMKNKIKKQDDEIKRVLREDIFKKFGFKYRSVNLLSYLKEMKESKFSLDLRSANMRSLIKKRTLNF